MQDDTDETADIHALAQLILRVRRERAQLALNLRAAAANRRTAEQVQRVIDRARAAVRRSTLVRQRHRQRGRVH